MVNETPAPPTPPPPADARPATALPDAGRPPRLLVALAAAAVVALVALLPPARSAAMAFDEAVAHALHDPIVHSETYRTIVWIVNIEKVGVAIGGLSILLYLIFLRKNSFRDNVAFGLCLALSFVALDSACRKISGPIHRPSPSKAKDFVLLERFIRDPGVHEMSSESFPSNRMTVMFGFFFLFWTRSRRLALALLPFILVVGAGRLALGSHWFSDEIGGLVMGMLFVALVRAPPPDLLGRLHRLFACLLGAPPPRDPEVPVDTPPRASVP